MQGSRDRMVGVWSIRKEGRHNGPEDNTQIVTSIPGTQILVSKYDSLLKETIQGFFEKQLIPGWDRKNIKMNLEHPLML